MAESLTFLGVISDFADFASQGIVRLYVSKSRLLKIKDLLMAAAASRALSPTDAARLVGKLQFACAWTFGRFGRAALQPFVYHSKFSSDKVSTAFLRALLFFIGLLPHLPVRIARTWGDGDRLPILLQVV